MDQAGLAELLVTANGNQRGNLLTQHAALVDANLAWTLKTLYDESESSDPARAAQIGAALSALSRVASDVQVSAIAAWTVGMVLLDEGQLEAALARLEAAEKQFLSSGLPVQAASTQVSTLRALAMLGRFDEALECGVRARDIFLAHDQVLTTGKIEQNLGNIHFMLDRYLKAEAHYRAARELYETVGDQKQLAQIDNCLATALTSQHRFREAETIYEQAFVRAGAAGLEVTLAEIEANQGCLSLFQGHFDVALEYLERSRRRYAALGLSPYSATADQELADAYMELNLVSEAAAIYERIIPLFAELEMKTEQARALVYHGRARLALGQNDQALRLLAQARSFYKETKNPVGEAMVTLIEAQAHYAAGDYATASALAMQAEPPFADVNAWGRLLAARWLQGDSARQQGIFHEAENILESVLRDAKQWTVLPLIQRSYTSLGLLAEARRDMPAAEIAFKKAVAAIEEVRAPLPAEEFRTAFLADKLIPYTELARICLADGTPGRVVEALGYVEQSRSRALVDMMAGAVPVSATPNDAFEADLFGRLEALREELNWFYSQINRQGNEDASRSAAMMTELYSAVRERETAISEITLQLRQRNATPPSPVEPFDVASLKRDLGSETALVEYFSLDGELLAFLVTEEGIETIHLSATEVDVEKALRQFHFQLGALRYGAQSLRMHIPELTARTQDHLALLYKFLLRPIESRLGTRRLVVVPHRVLHYVPFHALFDGSNYVIERREVCSVPSASVLQHCLSVPWQTLESAALLGVPDEYNPRVREEVLALAPLFPEAVTLLDDQANHASLHQHAPGVQVLHLACHGRFRLDNPLFSSLQLSDSWLTVRDVYRLNLKHCELVTLSACETGVSVLKPGDEWIGLARGFFSAGAPSLVVSQWAVDDEATERFMVDFYTRLLDDARPGTALRYAQCQLLQDKPHPYFWAPFVLLGRW